MPSDDATEVLIEAMAKALYARDTQMEDCWVTEDLGSRGWYRDMAAAALAALTVPVVWEDCPTCGGSGCQRMFAAPESSKRWTPNPDCMNGKVTRRALDVFADKTRETT